MFLATRAPTATIAVTGYPHLFGTAETIGDSCSIGIFKGSQLRISAELAGQANFIIDQVNATIEGAVDAYKLTYEDPNVVYVDVAEDFAGHGLCDTGTRWISGMSSSASRAAS